MSTKINIHELKRACSSCNMRELCMPLGMPVSLLEKMDEVVYVRKHFKSGAVLYHAGAPFHALYAVKSGFIKTVTLHEDGREQITGFCMMGEIFGFDGIGSDKNMCTSTAIEDSEVCIIPLDRVEHLSHGWDELQHHFYRLMSREIVREQTIMMLLGSMQGEERIASFLLNLSQRYQDRGYSPYSLVLRMKREEIGSYLGMKLESVSRILSKFQNQGLLKVHRKNVSILDIDGLRKLISQHSCKLD